MEALGTHLLVECRGCAPERLDAASDLERALRAAAERIGTRVLNAAFHCFEPQGVTGVLLLEESHMSIHTWPEHGYAAVDLYTCGAGDPSHALPLLRDALGARELEYVAVQRGAALRVSPPRRC